MKTKTVVSGIYNLRIALAPFLSSCPNILTLGVRPCLDDYSEQEIEMLRNARRVFFPTRKYVDIFQACQVPTFPYPTTLQYQRSRILQQLLFHYTECPHPHARIYYGRKQKQRILDHFRLPVLVMRTLNTPGTVHLAHSANELESLVNMQHSVIVCEFIKYSECVKFICVQFEPIGALRQAGGFQATQFRVGDEGTRTCGKHAEYVDAAIAEPVPVDSTALTKPLGITKELLRAARLDDISIELGNANGKWLVIGMSRPPVKWVTPRGSMNRHHYICEQIQSGVL